jgi:hypothetical protein
MQETLRRSHSRYTTLVLALYYLFKIRPHLPQDQIYEHLDDAHSTRVLWCGRRMFLSALILASKYLQDRNYSARGWSKISGLSASEITENEHAFVKAIQWNLYVTHTTFERWSDVLLGNVSLKEDTPSAIYLRLSPKRRPWKLLVSKLEPDLSNVDDIHVADQASDCEAGNIEGSSNIAVLEIQLSNSICAA